MLEHVEHTDATEPPDSKEAAPDTSAARDQQTQAEPLSGQSQGLSRGFSAHVLNAPSKRSLWAE